MSESNPDAGLARSATSIALGIAEIRDRILRLLDEPDLASMMRVERKGMAQVARLLYHEIDYADAQEMGDDTPSMRICCAAVRTIHARNIPIPALLKFQIILEHTVTPSGVQAVDPDEIPEESEELPLRYQPAFVKHVMLSLRPRFPNVHTVHMGQDHRNLGPEVYWVVTLPVADGEASLHPPAAVSAKGQVEVYRTRTYHDGDSPQAVIPIPTPSADYTIRERFDLDIRWDEDRSGVNCQEWLNALEEDDVFGDVFAAVRFATLPVTLDLLAGLYRKQIKRGHAPRIDSILANHAAPWRADNLQTLSSIASSSLRVLFLADNTDDDQAHSALVSFSDLPRITDIVRSNLPHLRVFHFALSGVDTAESVCGEMLSPSLFDSAGPVNSLSISLAPYNGPFFNVVRCLAGMCRWKADICVTAERGRSLSRGIPNQTAYLQYIRGQTRKRRLHLATADFATLDINTLEEVLQLTYNTDGTPIRRGLAKATAWAEDALAAAQVASSIQPSIPGILQNFAEAVKQFQGICATQPSATIIWEAEKLLEMVGTVRSVGDQLREVAGQARQIESEMREYVEVMKEIQDVEEAL